MSPYFHSVSPLPLPIMGSNDIDIISANVRGLRQQFKRFDLFEYFKKIKADIVCLQETHLVQKDLSTLKKDWNIEYFIAGNSTNSRGVAVLTLLSIQ